MGLSLCRLSGIAGELVGSAFLSSSTGRQAGRPETLASHLPICSQLHSPPFLCSVLISGVPLPAGFGVFDLGGGTDGRLKEEVRGHGVPPKTYLPHGSTFTPQMLAPWSRSLVHFTVVCLPQGGPGLRPR